MLCSIGAGGDCCFVLTTAWPDLCGYPFPVRMGWFRQRRGSEEQVAYHACKGY